MLSSIIISNDALKRFKDGELWFAKPDVIGRKPNVAGIARLLDKKKRFLGTAFLSPTSKYYLRVFSRSDENIDKEFWRRKLLAAFKRREVLYRTTNAFRVVHAESDGLSSVVIDKYNDIWAIQITSEGAETIKKELIDIMIEEFEPLSIIEKNNIEARKREGLPVVDRVVFGKKTETIIKEGDKNFEVDVLHGQKTGAYLDYRGFRLKAREFAKGVCLDAFSYQGWFACQIAEAASRVISIDSSAGALKIAEQNAKRNDLKNIEFIKADVLKYLKKCEEKFDFIHLDPPSFAKGRMNLKPAILGYRKMLGDALALLSPNGIIMISSCSHAITENVLERTLVESLNTAELRFEIIYRGVQDKDHPVLQGHPESLYLKAIACKIISHASA